MICFWVMTTDNFTVFFTNRKHTIQNLGQKLYGKTDVLINDNHYDTDTTCTKLSINIILSIKT